MSDPRPARAAGRVGKILRALGSDAASLASCGEDAACALAVDVAAARDAGLAPRPLDLTSAVAYLEGSPHKISWYDQNPPLQAAHEALWLRAVETRDRTALARALVAFCRQLDEEKRRSVTHVDGRVSFFGPTLGARGGG